jgi:hypothetical protein
MAHTTKRIIEVDILLMFETRKKTNLNVIWTYVTLILFVLLFSQLPAKYSQRNKTGNNIYLLQTKQQNSKKIISHANPQGLVQLDFFVSSNFNSKVLLEGLKWFFGGWTTEIIIQLFTQNLAQKLLYWVV